MNPTTMSQPHMPPRETERQGDLTVPYTRIYPQVRGGQCEYCGVLDNTLPATEQYKLCPHYRNMGAIRCSYCDASRDPNEVMRMAVMNVHDHPYEKDAYGRPKLVVVCDRYECSNKHLARFGVNK